jgi:hypothetical protein
MTGYFLPRRVSRFSIRTIQAQRFLFDTAFSARSTATRCPLQPDHCRLVALFQRWIGFGQEETAAMPIRTADTFSQSVSFDIDDSQPHRIASKSSNSIAWPRAGRPRSLPGVASQFVASSGGCTDSATRFQGVGAGVRHPSSLLRISLPYTLRPFANSDRRLAFSEETPSPKPVTP